MWPHNSIYFYTLSTFLHFPYFREDTQKQIVLNQFNKIREKYKVKIDSYSIAINHFHLKFYLENSDLMKNVLQTLRGGTAFDYRKKFGSRIKYKEMWQSRKIYVITSAQMNWRITGYIAGNLLKHKEVNTFQELKENKFSCYKHYAKIYGDGEIQELIRSLIDINETAEGEVDLNNLTRTRLKTKVLSTPTKVG